MPSFHWEQAYTHKNEIYRKWWKVSTSEITMHIQRLLVWWKNPFLNDRIKYPLLARSGVYSRENWNSSTHKGERDGLLCLFLPEQTHSKLIISE